jgi:hypothetical protein
LLKQLSDFLEISKMIVISLKSIEGRKKYEKVFGKKLKDKKANPIIRIIATLLPEFCFLSFASRVLLPEFCFPSFASRVSLPEFRFGSTKSVSLALLTQAD